MTVDPPRIAHT